MRTAPDPAVVAWLDRQLPHLVWTTSITVFEIQFGLGLLAAGRRKDALLHSFQLLIADRLERRVLAFDAVAAQAAALLQSDRRRKGRSGDLQDALIAGLVLAADATLVTRNTRHFADLNVPVINPWTA